MVGFLTFDSALHFYNLKASLAAPQMLVVTELDEPFLPLPDDLLVMGGGEGDGAHAVEGRMLLCGGAVVWWCCCVVVLLCSGAVEGRMLLCGGAVVWCCCCVVVLCAVLRCSTRT